MKSRRKLPPIDIRDQRLRGGRLAISARTDSLPTWRRRDGAVRRLLEMGELDLIERLRDRRDPLHIADVQRAVEANDLDSLRRVGDAEYGPLTLGAQIDRLLTTVEATKAAGTLHQYRVMSRLLLERFGADTPMREIGSDMLERWLHEPKQSRRRKDGTPVGTPKPWSRARQQLALAIIGRLWNTTIRKEAELADRRRTAPRLVKNPVANVELATERTKRVEFLQPHEWRTLSRAVEGRAMHAVLALGTLAGLRLGEALHLRPEIDVVGLGTDTPLLRIQPREGEFPWQPKTEASVRDVPIGAELQRILAAHIESGFSGERYLIRVPGFDRPMSRQGMERWVADAFASAGIRYGRTKDALTYHSLRHSFISWLVQADVSLMKISLIAGTSVDMILRVYGHLIDRDLRGAVGVIDQRLSGGAE